MNFIVAQAASDREVQGFEPRTIGGGIRRHAELRPGQPAMVASRYAALSYRELRDRIDAIGTVLRRAGFDRNARIVVALENDPEAALAIVAVACAAVAVPLDPKLALPEIETRLALLRPNALLVLRDSSSAARTLAERRGLTIIEAIVPGDGRLDLQLAVPQVGPALPLGDPDPDAPAFILQTSGTTADPNLVPFSHRNMLAAKERLQTWFALMPQDRCLSVTPVCYSHGLKVSVLAPLLTGGSVAFPASASKVDLSEWLGALRPTWYSATPTLHLAVLEKARSLPDARTMHSLRFVSSAAAPLPREVHEGFRAVLGVPVLQHYGSSEAAQIACNHVPPGPSKYGTCGVPWPGTVAIVGRGRTPSASRRAGRDPGAWRYRDVGLSRCT